MDGEGLDDIIIIYLLNIAPFNIKMIKSALHEFKNLYKITILIMNYPEEKSKKNSKIC